MARVNEVLGCSEGGLDGMRIEIGWEILGVMTRRSGVCGVVNEEVV